MLLHTHDGNAVTTANPLPVQLTGAEALVFAPVASATVSTVIDPLGVIAADATRKTTRWQSWPSATKPNCGPRTRDSGSRSPWSE